MSLSVFTIDLGRICLSHSGLQQHFAHFLSIQYILKILPQQHLSIITNMMIILFIIYIFKFWQYVQLKKMNDLE